MVSSTPVCPPPVGKFVAATPQTAMTLAVAAREGRSATASSGESESAGKRHRTSLRFFYVQIRRQGSTCSKVSIHSNSLVCVRRPGAAGYSWSSHLGVKVAQANNGSCIRTEQQRCQMMKTPPLVFTKETTQQTSIKQSVVVSFRHITTSKDGAIHLKHC